MIPSLLQIPSAVSDSKLHSVLPNNGKGDFQFDRSTGATRINRDGLIEEVGYFSSELVQNGNFSELGSELVTNGDFTTDSDWTKGGSWIINNGKASIDYNDGSDGRLTQGISFTQNKTYKVVFTISNYVSGNFRIEFRFGGSSTVSSNFNANGTYTLYLTAGQNHTQFSIRSLSNPIGSIDNVSVKQVDTNDRWIKGSGWSYGTNKAEKTAGTGSILSQSNVVEANKKYKVSFDVVATAGYIDSVFIGGQSEGTNITASGSYSYIFDTTNTDSLGFNANSAFAGSVTNISVVEVQGDRPRLSYDITNGVVEDTPHLLLEPSSTNLAKFSYNIQGGVDSGDYIKGANSVLTYVSDIEAPDGTMGVYRVQNAAQSGTFLSFYTGNSKNVSVYVKAVDVNNNNQFSLFKSAGSPQASSVLSATSDWKRYSFEYAQSSGNTGINNEGDAYASDVYIWGAQVEDANSYATSLIPTAGTTITRAAETCNNSKPSLNSTEGVLYVEIAALANDLSERQLSIDDETGNNRIIIRYNAVSNNINAYLFASSVQGGEFNYVSSDITQFSKIAFKWKANDFALWVDGSKRAEDTSGNTFSAGTLKDVSFDFNGNFDFYGKVKGLAVYNEALTDAQLITLTS